jgi:serine/threonine protein kinase
MGAVYQAWDKVLEVAVAVKVIRPPDTEDEEAAQTLERRFKRELLLARQVTHKHVVRIHDLGEIDGITYITMPYVHGVNLAAVLKKEGRMPVERTVGIVRQIASGLAAAHEAGVVHRDLKPANIMIEAEGNALIMDFGIARSTSGVTGPSMTAGGAIVGTIEYMAPEQATGVPVDHRADIYSLGLILNDLLLGRRQGNSSTAVAELMARIKDPPAPIRIVDPTLPAALEAIVTRCLQPSPAARYQHIGELLLDLGAGEGPRRAADRLEHRHVPWWCRRPRRAIACLDRLGGGRGRGGRSRRRRLGVSRPAVRAAGARRTAGPVLSLAICPSATPPAIRARRHPGRA